MKSFHNVFVRIKIMQNKKNLTLDEDLKLDRQPTLQEMVDLSEKDYTKYLYCQGIIKYIPERLEDYEVVDEYDGYYPKVDIALELKNPRWEILLEEQRNSDDEELNESEDDKNLVNLYPDWKDCEPTYGIVEDVNGKRHQYYLDETGCIFMYKGEDLFYIMSFKDLQ